MSCNNNSFLDDLKAKLDSIELPQPDFSQLESKLTEAQNAINDAIGDVAGFLSNAITDANKSLQDQIAALQKSTSESEFAAKLAEIRKDFGDAVSNLEEIISNATNGLEASLSSAINNFDSDFESAQSAVSDFLTGAFSFPSVCDSVPNIEKKPDGTVVEKPPAPVAPAAKPADPPPPVETQPNAFKTQPTNDHWRRMGTAAMAGAISGGNAMSGLWRKRSGKWQGDKSTVNDHNRYWLVQKYAMAVAFADLWKEYYPRNLTCPAWPADFDPSDANHDVLAAHSAFGASMNKSMARIGGWKGASAQGVVDYLASKSFATTEGEIASAIVEYKDAFAKAQTLVYEGRAATQVNTFGGEVPPFKHAFAYHFYWSNVLLLG